MVVKDLKSGYGESDSKKDMSVRTKVVSCFYGKKPGHIKANCYSLKGHNSNLNLNNPVAK